MVQDKNTYHLCPASTWSPGWILKVNAGILWSSLRAYKRVGGRTIEVSYPLGSLMGVNEELYGFGSGVSA